MSVAVLRTRSYDNDLERIWLCLRQKSVEHAKQVLRQIESRVDLLGQFADMGEQTPQFGANCRRIIVGRYLVFYERWEDRVEVLHAMHSSRDIQGLDLP